MSVPFQVKDALCGGNTYLAPLGLPLAMPLALVPLVSPRPPLVPAILLAPRLFSPELGREVEEPEVAYFEVFLADAGFSKNEVSVVLAKCLSD